MLRLAVMLVVLASPVEAAEQCSDSHEVVASAMREDMVGKAKFNGEVVTGVLLKGLCTSGFVTRSGTTWIDWTTVDNDDVYRLGDTMLMKIPRNGGFDAITYEGDPHVAMHIRMSIGLLGSDCYDHGRFC